MDDRTYPCASCGTEYPSSLAALACAADDDDLRSQFTD